jgi:hypothetical protein
LSDADADDSYEESIDDSDDDSVDDAEDFDDDEDEEDDNDAVGGPSMPDWATGTDDDDTPVRPWEVG